MPLTIAFLDGLSPVTLLFIAVIAVLLFGEQLPDVARTWGKKFVRFRRNIQGLQEELRSAAFSATSEFTGAMDSATSSFNATAPGASAADEEAGDGATAPKFDPPSSETALAETAPPSLATAQTAAAAKVVSEAGSYEIPKFQPVKRSAS
jgi:sec-independent protein translocase protein TatA